MARAFSFLVHSKTVIFLLVIYHGCVGGEEGKTELRLHTRQITTTNNNNCNRPGPKGGVKFLYKSEEVNEQLRNGYPEGTEATHIVWDCPPGYSITNNQSRYCQSDGTWNGTDPNCAAILGEIKETSSNWLLIWACVMSVTSAALTIALGIMCYRHIRACRKRIRSNKPYRYDVVRRVHCANRFSTTGHSDIVRESQIQSPYQDLSVRIEETGNDTYFQPFDMVNLPSPIYVEIDRFGVDTTRESANVNSTSHTALVSKPN